MEAQWRAEAVQEEATQRAVIATFPKAQLRREDVLQRWLERREQQERKAAAQYKGPSPSM